MKRDLKNFSGLCGENAQFPYRRIAAEYRRVLLLRHHFTQFRQPYLCRNRAAHTPALQGTRRTHKGPYETVEANSCRIATEAEVPSRAAPASIIAKAC